MHPRPTLPGGATTEELHSLNGLGMIINRSGDYVDPLRWRNGIQGIGDLETYPGSGGSDPLLRNPIHPMLAGLGETLTPGLHGLMPFPGSGGNDVLVRNPIHPAGAHAWLVSSAQLGGKNKLADSLQTAPGTTTDGTAITNAATAATDPSSELSNILSLSWAAKLFGLSGLGCVSNPGLGCGCGCNGSGGCGAGVSTAQTTTATHLSGLGDTTTDAMDTGPTTLETLFLNTGLDFTLAGSLFGGIPNWALYGGAAIMALTAFLAQGEYKAASAVLPRRRKKRNPRRRRTHTRARRA